LPPAGFEPATPEEDCPQNALGKDDKR